MTTKSDEAKDNKVIFKPRKDTNKRKQERLMAYLKNSKETNFTGYVKINFSQGNIGRIEKFEEILK